MNNKVTFILDDKFDGDLTELALKNHVWIIGSKDNLIKVHQYWEIYGMIDYPNKGVTTVSIKDDKVAGIYENLSTIDVHHNECSTDKPWEIIEVIGIDIERISLQKLMEGIAEYKIHVQKITNGFQIVRTA
jgi:hypothetical protein